MGPTSLLEVNSENSFAPLLGRYENMRVLTNEVWKELKILLLVVLTERKQKC
jgi:hypothetical protein